MINPPLTTIHSGLLQASVASWTVSAAAVDAATEAVRRVLAACDARKPRESMGVEWGLGGSNGCRVGGVGVDVGHLVVDGSSWWFIFKGNYCWKNIQQVKSEIIGC